MHAILDQCPPAVRYYSAEFSTYQGFVSADGKHDPMPDKRETYAVEGFNADFRQHLARLARRSHCFSWCLVALRRTVQLFVSCYNHRQCQKHTYPQYASDLIDVV